MIKTKASLIKEKELEKEFKGIKFQGLPKLPSTTRPPSNSHTNGSDDEEFEAIFGDGKRQPKKKNEVTYESARREILNFGIAGSKEKSDYTTQLLIKLGAKKPKNVARNYKEILHEKHKQKLEESKVNKRAIFGTSHSLQYRNQRKNTRKDDGLLKKYGRVDKADKRKIKEGLKKRV